MSYPALLKKFKKKLNLKTSSGQNWLALCTRRGTQTQEHTHKETKPKQPNHRKLKWHG